MMNIATTLVYSQPLIALYYISNPYRLRIVVGGNCRGRRGNKDCIALFLAIIGGVAGAILHKKLKRRQYVGDKRVEPPQNDFEGTLSLK
jgi:hypothetical protein